MKKPMTTDLRALCAELIDELNYRADEHSVDKLIARARTALATPPPEPVAYIHRQGNYWEPSERVLQDDEKERGWTEEPLYAATPPPEPPAAGDVSELMRCVADSLSSFKITQDPAIYPADHWSRRAAELLERTATPPPAPPTDEELYEYWISTSPQFGCADPVVFARAALERWGK